MKREKFLEQLKQNQKQDLKIVEKKNDDYAQGFDPFQNFRMVEDAGLMKVEKGICVRMSDKMQRIFNLIDEEASVDDETVADTLSDLRNYANILQVYLEQEKNSEPEKPFKVQSVFEGVKQEPKYVEAEEPFTPLELPDDEEWYCYIQTRDQV